MIRRISYFLNRIAPASYKPKILNEEEAAKVAQVAKRVLLHVAVGCAVNFSFFGPFALWAVLNGASNDLWIEAISISGFAGSFIGIASAFGTPIPSHDPN